MIFARAIAARPTVFAGKAARRRAPGKMRDAAAQSGQGCMAKEL
jgi:hypothetical protein